MKRLKWMIVLTVVSLLTTTFGTIVLASNTGNIVGTAGGTQKAALSQAKTVVNNVVFPAINLVLAMLFFVKVVTAYMGHRKYGQTEWAPAVILLAGLVFSLLAPMYVWQIVGI